MIKQTIQSSVAHDSESLGARNLALVSMEASYGSELERQNGDFPNFDGLKKTSCRRIIWKEKVRLVI